MTNENFKQRTHTTSTSNYAVLISLWLFVTAFNLTKPIHMDDAVYLYGARAVTQNPLRPYDATISWGHQNYGPLNTIAQPVLTFYGLAAVISIFGESELALHLYQSLFALIAIVCFFRLLTVLRIDHRLMGTALFCASPGFIPSQNLMTDLPLVTIGILFFCLLLPVGGVLSTPRNAQVACTAALCCLVKYLGAVFLPIYALSLCTARPTVKRLLPVLIPPIILGLWCLYTFVVYGRMHVSQHNIEKAGDRFWLNTRDWFVCLGAITPFSFLFLRKYFDNRYLLFVLLAGAVSLVFSIPSSLEGAVDKPTLAFLLRLFWANGVFVAFSSTFLLLQVFFLRSGALHERWMHLWLWLWLLFGLLFIAFFAEYMGVRHVLFVLPAVVIATTLAASRAGTFERVAAVLVTATLGGTLGLSDYRFAAVYRDTAKAFAESYRSSPQLWVLGPWGWQWYGEKNGMKAYAWDAPLKNGDIIVRGEIPSNENLNPEHEKDLYLIEEKVVPSDWRTAVRTMSAIPWGGYYASSNSAPPYRFSRAPLEHFSVYQFITAPATSLSLPVIIDFAAPPPHNIALSGFNAPEPWGRWTSRQEAVVKFNGVFPRSCRVFFRAKAYSAGNRILLKVASGESSVNVELGGEFQEYRLPLECTGEHGVSFALAEPPRAPILGGGDQRTLGFAIRNLEVN